MPIIKAFPVGLILKGVITSTLADGKIQPYLYCLGEVVLETSEETKTKIGIVSLMPTDADILIGMEFLRKFDLRMDVDPASNSLVLSDLYPQS